MTIPPTPSVALDALKSDSAPCGSQVDTDWTLWRVFRKMGGHAEVVCALFSLMIGESESLSVRRKKRFAKASTDQKFHCAQWQRSGFLPCHPTSEHGMPQPDHQKQGAEAPLKAIQWQQPARESENYVLNKTPDSPFINLYRPGIPNRADTGIGIPDRHKSSLHIQPEDCFISSKGRFLRNLASRVNPTSCAVFYGISTNFREKLIVYLRLKQILTFC